MHVIAKSNGLQWVNYHGNTAPQPIRIKDSMVVTVDNAHNAHSKVITDGKFYATGPS